MTSQITLVAALASNRCIGHQNQMPWHIPEDFAFFKQYTLGKPVIMGRKTWDSLPRKPLPERKNIVITRQASWQESGADTVHSLQAALNKLADVPEIIIMGGAQIYAEALPLATDMRLTEVHANVSGDAFFPAFPINQWRESSRSTHVSAKNGLVFDFVHYTRTDFLHQPPTTPVANTLKGIEH
ncbi:dihydrofolate reductase [Snodgrassella sp. CFCC 13594]|uniref:dihydrofolate reductase n=1 Tax=Snodgrassella sp. CFCC 13594 TaxID=1775559 RepID=UPI0009EF300E|nr:dihydrofolate reductase [Snodgrassella sp. CFCC 13594]